MSTRKTGEQLVEEGVGLIAQGAFRTKEQQGAEEAVACLDAVITVVIGMKHDFMRQAARVL